MNQKFMLIPLIILMGLNIVYAGEEIKCFGSDCYTSEYQVPLKIKEMFVDTILHNDGSVSYSQTIGLFYQWDELPFNKEGILLPEFPLPQHSEISTHIKVKELISDLEYKEVYFFEDDCYGQFIFHRDRNVIEMCIQPQKQLKIYFETLILSDKNQSTYEYCGNVTDSISNTIELAFAPANYKYFMSVSSIGDENVLIDHVANDACKEEENATLKFSDMRLIPKSNGMLCQGDILPMDKYLVFTLKAAGKNYAKIKEKENQEIIELQKENIRASIRASEATISTSTFTKWNVAIAFLLVLITLLNVLLFWLTNKPLVKVKLDPFGVNNIVLKIVNVGKDTAHKVKVKYKIIPDDKWHEWNRDMMQHEDSARIIPKDLPELSLKDFVQKYDKIIVESSWKDSHGIPIKNNYEIDLKEFQKSINDNLWLYDTTLKEDIEQISKKIKEMSDTLKSKNIKIDVKGVEMNPQKIKSEIKLYEKLGEQRKQKLDELKKREPESIKEKEDNSKNSKQDAE